MSDRNNFATMAQLEAACNEARTVLRRRNPTQVSLRHAGLQLNQAVRTLRSWLGSRNDELRHARRIACEERSRADKAAVRAELAQIELARRTGATQ
jgi:translation initiation factor 2B subunit (eIF-2B alpha/beta/delta family)